ncbi:hypothetical protein [Lactobacillus sp. ESL0228]|uniref:hypothetical protein n=1 Tax=Lactobacillus sp. ESL0228 TaxID=2069352 RepID=UPI000EFD4879|nr:hypothetical protein [Lactobacillus sp. ESL0228]RMC48888.1 hypothetical protein F5ESL0228_04630 [Lactobacillus sp. ESL0228]
MESIKDMFKLFFSLLKSVINFAISTLKPYVNPYIKLLIIFFVSIIFIVIAGYFIDKNKHYTSEDVLKKLNKYDWITNSQPGKQVYLIKYWIWQRNKRKVIVHTLSYLSRDGRYYPKQKFKKVGPVRFPFKRVCWLLYEDMDMDKLNQYR